jgi:hypothetical protein
MSPDAFSVINMSCRCQDLMSDEFSVVIMLESDFTKKIEIRRQRKFVLLPYESLMLLYEH